MGTLVDHASQFGANGYFALLIGQKVEYRHPFQLSAEELRIWNAQRRKYKNMAIRGLSVQGTLAKIASPSRQWQRQ
jgi:hypothetical protein